MNSLPEDYRLCFIGDSFVNGTGDPDKLGWPGRLCALSEDNSRHITYYNLGVRKESSEDIQKRWLNECRIRLPEASKNALIFSFGVNDSLIENGQIRVKQGQSLINAREILSQAKEQYPTLMIGPPPIDNEDTNKRIKMLDKQLSDLCDVIGVSYLSIFQTLKDNFVWHKEVTQNDGAHPQADGYQLLAEIIYRWPKWQGLFKQ